MRLKILTILIILPFLKITANGRNTNKLGIRAGVNYNVSKSNKLGGLSQVLDGERINSGYTIGVFYKTDYYEYDLYFQPEFMYSRYNAYADFNYNTLDFNLLVGKPILKIFRLKVGPTGMWNILPSQESKGYNGTFKSFRMGYQLGTALEIGPIALDVAYRGSFSGNNTSILGKEITLDNTLSQFVFSVSYFFE